MKNISVAAVLVLGALVFGISSIALPQTQAAPAGQVQVGTLGPGLDDLMTTLVQPRHLKLYYAGTRRNWELAAAESRELRSAFVRITQAIPSYQNNKLDEVVASMLAPRMQAMDAAIAAADPKRFLQAYDELTAACNACHTYLEHPFLVIKVPEAGAASAYPDQEFKAAP